MKAREVSSDIIQRSLICYVKISIPSLSAPCRSKKQFSLTPSSNASTAEQKEVFEFIVTNLPLEKRSNSSPGLLKFLFRLLGIVNILNASEACRTILEKKIGSQLEHATLDDLLIHSNSADVNESSTLYDIDCVSRILRYFVEGLDKTMMRSMMLVGKLMDDYLAHIASDENLKPNNFYKLAVALPVQARRFHDGLYRAVDVYFKAHSWLSEEEREKMFMVMDCQKLTVEACTLAAQNYRLPSRVLVVLFAQQLQALYAIPEPSLRAAANGDIQSPHLDSTRRRHSHLHPKFQHQQQQEEDMLEEEHKEETDNSAITGNMSSRRHELERECSNIKKTTEKIEKRAPGGVGLMSSLSKIFGCKLNTQVFDSHKAKVLLGNWRKGGRRHQYQTRGRRHQCEETSSSA